MLRGLVGAVEIQREADVQHARQADRHVGVAGEIEIDLQGVGERGVPGLEEGQGGAVGGGVEAGIGETAEHVGQHQLLAEAEQEDEQPVGEVLDAGPGEVAGGELRDDVRRPDDRPGDQVRKEGDKTGIGEERRDQVILAAGDHRAMGGQAWMRRADAAWRVGRLQARLRCCERAGRPRPPRARYPPET